MGSNPINGFGIGEQEPEPEPIAIVGIAFEFPQEATTEESFWQMISNGRSAHTDFPKDRVNIDAFYHPDDGRNSTVRAPHCLTNERLIVCA
jgi:acyl transferase domain-containing protein